MRPLLVCLFLLISTAGSFAAEGIPLYNALRNSIVTIKGRSAVTSEEGKTGTYETIGAGAILDVVGTIATNTHVIYGSQTIEVTLVTHEVLMAKVLYVSPQNDLSIIKIEPWPLMPRLARFFSITFFAQGA